MYSIKMIYTYLCGLNFTIKYSKQEWEIPVIDKKWIHWKLIYMTAEAPNTNVPCLEKQRMQESSFIRRKLKLKETSKY